MAEVTHNETADPSMNFQQPEHNSPDEQPSSWDPRAPASFSTDGLSESEQSLDLFRAKDPGTSVTTPPAWHDSSSLLITSQDHAHQSVLGSSLKNLEVTTCSGAAEAGILEQSQITLVSLTDTSLLTDEEHPDVVKEEAQTGGKTPDPAQPHDRSRTRPGKMIHAAEIGGTF